MAAANGANTVTGQWREETDGRRWWFDSGSLALDFAHTGALHDRECLTSTEALGSWLAEHVDTVKPGASDARLEDALMLRGGIARLAEAAWRTATPAPEDVDVLNLFAAMPDVPPALGGGARQAGRASATARQALSSIARDAIALLGGPTANRLRRCDATDCRLLYLDTSRAGSRRWCSMQRCGNRAKVRAHRRRNASRADTALTRQTGR
ncbi:CGNR zinc finger domain-containing protein [Rathayibacter toxicus]|uniref:CGNR zinc finger domain-containing protein n=1 Tax=Rathayibacter toxicus TaxID=145458 RepID=UPI001FEA2599|nr:CGNR zinc finger domain-containing protein [Rathayibacter toxicus]